MKSSKFIVASALFLVFSASSQAALVSVGGGLGVQQSPNPLQSWTWTSDANLLGTMEVSFGKDKVVSDIINASGGLINDIRNKYDASSSGNVGTYNLSSADFGSNGSTTWWGAMAFVNYLNATSYGNSTHWSLPTFGMFGQDTASAMGALFYSELGGKYNNPIPGSTLFTNVQNAKYWYKNEYSSDLSTSVYFDTSKGDSNVGDKKSQFYAWALTSDPVTPAVPEPETYAMLLAGLGLLGTIARRREKKQA